MPCKAGSGLTKIKPDCLTYFNGLVFLSTVFEWPEFIVFHLLIDEPENIYIARTAEGEDFVQVSYYIKLEKAKIFNHLINRLRES